MSESKTPRTDEIVKPFIGSETVSPNEASALLDFARTLELELNEAKRKLNAIELVRGTHDCGCEVCGMGSSVCPASASSYALAIVEAKDQLTTAQQELAKIAKALRTQQQRYHDLSEEVEGLKRERDDAIESTVKRCAQIAEESEACCGTGEIIAKKILSLIPQKEKNV